MDGGLTAAVLVSPPLHLRTGKILSKRWGPPQDGGSLTTQRRENFFLYDLPGVVSFFFKASKLELPQGFRTVWKTRPLVP